MNTILAAFWNELRVSDTTAQSVTRSSFRTLLYKILDRLKLIAVQNMRFGRCYQKATIGAHKLTMEIKVSIYGGSLSYVKGRRLYAAKVASFVEPVGADEPLMIGMGISACNGL